MISGFATSSGTKNFLDKHVDIKFSYKNFQGLTLSNIGIGTYLGDADEQTDIIVKNAVKESILSGVNVIDTAINYRAQKAERSVGNAISELISEEKIKRDEIFVSTKNGYVTNDGDIKEDFMQYIMREFGKTGIVKEGDISSGYHCMTIPFLEDQLNRSLSNLQLDCIDLVYLHNAVEGNPQMSSQTMYEKLTGVFEFYEQKRKEGKIRFYGLATWDCFRVSEDHNMFLSLEKVVDIARSIGGNDNGFRFIQLPYNLHFDQAFMQKNQMCNDKKTSILDSATAKNIGVFTSVPLMQGRLIEWAKAKPDFSNNPPSIGLLQFIRSTPGVLAPLVGHKSIPHVKENLQALRIPPLSDQSFTEAVKNLTK